MVLVLPESAPAALTAPAPRWVCCHGGHSQRTPSPGGCPPPGSWEALEALFCPFFCLPGPRNPSLCCSPAKHVRLGRKNSGEKFLFDLADPKPPR